MLHMNVFDQVQKDVFKLPAIHSTRNMCVNKTRFTYQSDYMKFDYERRDVLIVSIKEKLTHTAAQQINNFFLDEVPNAYLNNSIISIYQNNKLLTYLLIISHFLVFAGNEGLKASRCKCCFTVVLRYYLTLLM